MPVETNHDLCETWKVARHCYLDFIEEDFRLREGEMLNFINREDDKKYPLCVFLNVLGSYCPHNAM